MSYVHLSQRHKINLVIDAIDDHRLLQITFDFRRLLDELDLLRLLLA